MSVKLVWFVLCWNIFIVLCENFQSSRNGRFLKFDTTLDGDIGIDLDFSIPFVKIPLKKTMESFGTDIIFPTINVNVVGLALGGIAILGTAIILPFLTKSFGDDTQRYGRLLEQANFKANEVFELGSKFFENSNSVQDCTLRLACLTALQSSDTNSVHTLKHIARNGLLSRIMNTTAVDEALKTGWQRRSCQHYCPLDDNQLNILVSNMAGLKT